LRAYEHRENEAIVRAFVEAINQQGRRRFEELVAPDFVQEWGYFFFAFGGR
jgi:hypothetical protein